MRPHALKAGAASQVGTPAAQSGVIILVRHGRPDLSRNIRLNWRGYRNWWQSYGRAGLAPDEVPPEKLLVIADRATGLLSSTLPRARETAERLARRGQPIESLDLFVEAPLPAPPIPFVRLRPVTWGIISRVAWILGFSAKGESAKAAKARAELAADRLAERAGADPLVILCAHGWFNRMIRGALRARGWRCVYDGGDSYWSWRRMERP